MKTSCRICRYVHIIPSYHNTTIKKREKPTYKESCLSVPAAWIGGRVSSFGRGTSASTIAPLTDKHAGQVLSQEIL